MKYFCETTGTFGENVSADVFSEENLHLYEGEFDSDVDAVNHFLKLHGTQLRLVYYTTFNGFNFVADFRTLFRRFQ